ncbi:MAG: hypothetical protein HFF18_03695 [Oscillospiraceae bacterium]|nr:hypothetical protein [Oscillospiraceae bacterium]
MASEFERLEEAAGEFLLMEPAYLDPDQPTGLWFCDCPENVLSVRVNAVCLRPDAEWEDVGRCLAFLRRFRYVVIVCPGESQRALMVEKLRPVLPAVALYVVGSEGFRGCPTIRSYIETYGGANLWDILVAAVELPAYGLVDLASIPERDLNRIPRTLSGFPFLDRHIGGFFASEVSVWTGKRGSGKSTILGQILLSAVDQGHRVCAYSGELDKAQFREWIDLQAAGPEQVRFRTDPRSGKKLCRVEGPVRDRISAWLEGKFWLFDLDCASVHDEDRILAQFEYARLRYGADVFLVDNIMTVELKTRGDFYQAQSRFMGRLTAFAKRHQAHIHMVVHPRKTESGQVRSADDVGGSGDITNRADNVFLMQTAPTEEGGRAAERPQLSIQKNRDFGSHGCVNLVFDRKSRRLSEPGQDPNRVFGWALQGTQVVMQELNEETPFDGRRA